MSSPNWTICEIDWPFYDSQMVSEYWAVEAGKETIAYVFGETPEIRKECALLVAAAPDLLEALKRLVRVTEKDPNLMALRGHISLAKDAIAKAKGDK